jgi:hypothetical protein
MLEARMPGKFLTSVILIGLMIGYTFAQRAVPQAGQAADNQVIRVRVVNTLGMCGGGYCTLRTTVEPSFMVRESLDAANKKKFPDEKRKRAITKKDWKGLQNSVDVKALMAVEQPTRCNACIDLPASWVEVDFRDGTKLTRSYPYHGVAPAPIEALLRKIEAIARPTP